MNGKARFYRHHTSHQFGFIRLMGGLISRLVSICIATLVVISLVAISGCHARTPTPSDEQHDSTKPLIYTSFYPIHNITSRVAGDTVEIRSFMPQDKDPHLWEPTPKNIKELSQADLLIVNGANMERWLESVRAALPELPILVLSDSIELISYTGAAAVGDFQYLAELTSEPGTFGIEFGHTHEDIMRVSFFNNVDGLRGKELVDACKKTMEQKAVTVPQKTHFEVVDKTVYGIEMGHESGHVDFTIPTAGNWVFISDRISENLLPYDLVNAHGEKLNERVVIAGSSSGFDKVTYDPHSWLSLKNAKAYANAIQDALIEKYPEHEREYRKNKRVFVDELTGLEAEYQEKFKTVRIHEFVVSHYAFEYLAREFGLKQFPLQGLTSMESPSLKTIRKALDFTEYYQLNTIFYEYGLPQKEAQTIAEETNCKTQPLASMEYITPDQERENPDGYLGFMRVNLENLYNSVK